MSYREGVCAALCKLGMLDKEVGTAAEEPYPRPIYPSTFHAAAGPSKVKNDVAGNVAFAFDSLDSIKPQTTRTSVE